MVDNKVDTIHEELNILLEPKNIVKVQKHINNLEQFENGDALSEHGIGGSEKCSDLIDITESQIIAFVLEIKASGACKDKVQFVVQQIQKRSLTIFHNVIEKNPKLFRNTKGTLSSVEELRENIGIELATRIKHMHISAIENFVKNEGWLAAFVVAIPTKVLIENISDHHWWSKIKELYQKVTVSRFRVC